MISLPSLLFLAHLVGLALGVGAATVKLVLLLECRADPAFVPVFLKVVKPITRQIVLGIALLTLSGVGWLLLGYGWTPRLVVKVVLVVAIWGLGPVIDNVVEPRFRRLSPPPGGTVTPAFLRIQTRYLVLELLATSLFYVVAVFWVLR